MLTSFPPSLPAPYVQMFKAQSGADNIQVLNKNTIAGIDEVLRGNRRKFDIFWSSSPEAFALLRQHGAFVREGGCGAGGPAPVEAFALSAVGWTRRSDSDLFMPAEWNDLLKPLYRDRIAMARPARSGTTHMMLEQILQLRGWRAGWAFILELSGNLSTLTARSYGVPDGVLNDRFDIGLTIDFLAQSVGEELAFQYGRPLMVVPAQIGILRGGVASEAACRFVELVLSQEGQRALLRPDISRVPYDPAVRAAHQDRLPVDIVDALRLPWLRYDAKIAADRYWSVTTLFDLMVTENLNRRRELWRRYHALEAQAAPAEMRRLKTMLTQVILGEREASNVNDAEGVLRSTALVQLGPVAQALINDWRARVRGNLSRVDAALTALEARYGR